MDPRPIERGGLIRWSSTPSPLSSNWEPKKLTRRSSCKTRKKSKPKFCITISLHSLYLRRVDHRKTDSFPGNHGACQALTAFILRDITEYLKQVDTHSLSSFFFDSSCYYSWFFSSSSRDLKAARRASVTLFLNKVTSWSRFVSKARVLLWELRLNFSNKNVSIFPLSKRCLWTNVHENGGVLFFFGRRTNLTNIYGCNSH